MGKREENDGISSMIRYINNNPEAVQHLEEFLNGEPVNINPLPELPAPIMTLYSYKGVYFESLQEAEQIVEDSDNEESRIRVISYLGRVAGEPDVIMETFLGSTKLPTLYAARVNGGCLTYNWSRSTYKGEFCWDGHSVGIEHLYAEFRRRGVEFEKDLSGEEQKCNARYLELTKAVIGGSSK